MTSSSLPKIYLAPMEGVVDHIIRDIFTRLGGYDQCSTEFVRVTRQLIPPKVFYRYCPELHNKGRTAAGTPVFVQLLGGDPQLLGENAEVAVSLGALGIDLNFGCPAKTVNRHDGGATLLKNPERIFNIVTAVKKTVGHLVPVTAKVRLGFSDKTLCKEIAHAANDAQANHLTIHARTKEEGYEPPAHWEYIAQMKEGISIPVIANGDIWSVQDYKKCLEITGCPDVALGRAAFSSPGLAMAIKQTRAADLKLEPPAVSDQYSPLTSTTLMKIFREEFLPMNTDAKSERFALSRTKQWLKALSRHDSLFVDLFEKGKSLQEINEMHELLKIPTPPLSGSTEPQITSG